MLKKYLLALFATWFLIGVECAAANEQHDHDLARDIMLQLVAINTAPSGGDDMRQAVAILVR